MIMIILGGYFRMAISVCMAIQVHIPTVISPGTVYFDNVYCVDSSGTVYHSGWGNDINNSYGYFSLRTLIVLAHGVHILMDMQDILEDLSMIPTELSD